MEPATAWRVEYWASEVAEAEHIVSQWADALFAGMTNDEVLRWIRVLSTASAEHAAGLFAEGLEPEDLEWDIRFDLGWPSMQDRLVIGNMTVTQVVAEVRRRRAI